MFKVGEIALTQHCIKKPNNVEVEIIQVIHDNVYAIYCDGKCYLISGKNLKKLPPSNTPDTWLNCIWKPSTINVGSAI